MKKIMYALIVALVLMLSMGCSGNLFMDFASLPEPPSVSDAQSLNTSDPGAVTSFIDDVQYAMDNNGDFTDEEITEIAAALDSVSAPSDYSTAPKEEILAYEKAKATSGSLLVETNDEAFSIAGNVGEIIPSLTSDDGSEPDPGILLTQLIPSDVAEDEIAFADALNTLRSASGSFTDFGDSLIESGTGSDELFEGGQTGDVIQTAMISIVVGAAMDTLDDPGDPNDDPAQELIDIYKVVANPDSTQTDIDDAVAVFDSNSGGTDPFAELTSDTGAAAGILELAGINFK